MTTLSFIAGLLTAAWTAVGNVVAHFKPSALGSSTPSTTPTVATTADGKQVVVQQAEAGHPWALWLIVGFLVVLIVTRFVWARLSADQQHAALVLFIGNKTRRTDPADRSTRSGKTTRNAAESDDIDPNDLPSRAEVLALTQALRDHSRAASTEPATSTTATGLYGQKSAGAA